MINYLYEKKLLIPRKIELDKKYQPTFAILGNGISIVFLNNTPPNSPNQINSLLHKTKAKVLYSKELSSEHSSPKEIKRNNQKSVMISPTENNSSQLKKSDDSKHLSEKATESKVKLNKDSSIKS